MKADASTPQSTPWPQLLASIIKAHPLWLMGALLLVSSVLFLTIGAHGHWDFVLPLRGKKLLALMVVGFAVGTSTLLFQTLTHNPILTPSLLGFDALYVLIQSLSVFFLGAIGYTSIHPIIKFGAEMALMIMAAMLLFYLLFKKNQQDLTRLILVGVIFGVLFRSLSSLVARLIDPDEFVVVQSASFAQFTNIDGTLLSISMIICGLCAAGIWRLRHQCDVLMLGRTQAINLGVDYQRLTLMVLSLIAILVSVSTALVGPVTFFGLLVCALTNRITRTMAHCERLILVSLIAMVCLVLGQAIFEHILHMAGVLSVVIELAGGVVFLLLVLGAQRNRRPL